MNRKQFTFYDSFFQAISRIKKKADRADAYDAICCYALSGKEPDLDLLSDTAAMAFVFSKPILDSSRRKAESGKAGGERKQTASKTEANVDQTEAKPKQEKEQEKEEDKDKEQKLSPLPPFLSKPTLEQVEEYAKMRRSTANPKEFFEYYDSGGWRDREGKPVYNWQQAFVAWEIRERNRPKKSTAGSKVNYTQSDDEEIWKYVNGGSP